jgi:hypothetical protein
VFGAVISQNWGALKRPDHFSSPWLPEKNRVGQRGQAVDYLNDSLGLQGSGECRSRERQFEHLY